VALQRILAYIAEEAANWVSGPLPMAGILRREVGEGQQVPEPVARLGGQYTQAGPEGDRQDGWPR
jgi:hypothetical protein